MPPTPPARTHRRVLIPVLGRTALSVVLAVTAGLFINLTTDVVPEDWVKDHLILVLAVPGAVFLTGAGVDAWWQVRKSRRAQATETTATADEPANPTPTVQVIVGPGPPPALAPEPSSDPISNLPPRNPHFTGRSELLDEIHNTLTSEHPTSLVAAAGMGGVGKTQLALEYAHRHADAYTLRWWVPAESPLAITQGLALLARKLGLPDEPDLEAAAAVRTELARRQGWLLVFDNAEDPADLHPHLPSGDGKVLVTSRKPAFASLGRKLDIDLLPHDEAVEFLLDRTGSDDRATAARLAEALGRLPLALEQVGGFLDSVPGVDLPGYLERFNRVPERLLERGKPPDYPEPVARAWQLNIKELATSNPAAVDLLRLCAFLAPETPIPMDLITADIMALPEALLTAAESDPDLDEPVAALYRFSLLSRDRDGLRVHRLVQAVTRHALGEEAASWHARTVVVVLAGFPRSPGERLQWPRAAAIMPHAQQVTQVAAKDASAAVVALHGQILIYLTSRIELATLRAVDKIPPGFTEQVAYIRSPELTRTLGNTRILIREAEKRVEEMGAALERGLRREERDYGDKHPDGALTLTEARKVLGEARKLRTRLEEIMTLLEAEFSKDHPDMPTVRRALDELQGG